MRGRVPEMSQAFRPAYRPHGPHRPTWPIGNTDATRTPPPYPFCKGEDLAND